MMYRLYFIFLVLFGIFIFPQQKVINAKYVLNESEILLDNDDYKFIDEENKYYIRMEKERDSLRKANIMFTEFNHFTIERAMLDSVGNIFFRKLDSRIKLASNVKFGENSFNLDIDKNGRILNVAVYKMADKKICKQIRNILKEEEFQFWTPANYGNRNVRSIYRFSIIIDDDLSKYNLKNNYRIKVDNWYYPY